MTATKSYTKASAELTFFNGMVLSRRTTGNRDVGIFKERHPIFGRPWGVCIRNDGHCWGISSDFTTKHEAITFADKHFPQETKTKEMA